MAIGAAPTGGRSGRGRKSASGGATSRCRMFVVGCDVSQFQTPGFRVADLRNTPNVLEKSKWEAGLSEVMKLLRVSFDRGERMTNIQHPTSNAEERRPNNLPVGGRRSRQLLGMLLLTGLGWLIGQSWSFSETAHADVRQTERRQAFQSGAERNEAILREISGTLKSIDERLARLEKLAASIITEDSR